LINLEWVSNIDTLPDGVIVATYGGENFTRKRRMSANAAAKARAISEPVMSADVRLKHGAPDSINLTISIWLLRICLSLVKITQ